ncbi:putative Cell wall protein YJL171C/Tos1 [Plasmopara halstedii]
MTGLWGSVRILLWKNWRIKQRETSLNRGRLGQRWLYPALLTDVIIPLSVILLLINQMCDYNAQMVEPGGNFSELHQVVSNILRSNSLLDDQGLPEKRIESAALLLTALPLLLAKSNQSLAFLHRPDSLLFLEYLDRNYPPATELGISSYLDNSKLIPVSATASNEEADHILLEYPRQHDWKIYAGFDVRRAKSDNTNVNFNPLELMALFYQKEITELEDHESDDQLSKFYATEWTFNRTLEFPDILPFQMTLNLLIRENTTNFVSNVLLSHGAVPPKITCQAVKRMLYVARLQWSDLAATSPLGHNDSACIAAITNGNFSNELRHFLSSLVTKLFSPDQLNTLEVAALPKRPATLKAGPLESNIVFLLAYLFLWPYALLIRNIVLEKEQQLKEYLLIMGLPAMSLLISWFLLFFFAATVVAMIAALLLSGSMFAATLDGTIYFFLLLMIFASSVLLFGVAITPIFNKTKTAAACAPLIYFVLSAGTFIRSLVGDDAVASSESLTLLLEFLNDISSPVVFMSTLHGILGFDAVSLSIRPITYETVAMPCRLMAVQCAGYLLLGWYLEHVFPRTFGVQEKWYFIVQPSYWMPKKINLSETVDENEETMRLTDMDDESFDSGIDDTLREQSLTEYLEHFCPTLFVKSLSKTYPNGKVALSNVSFGVRKGEIFGLLGPNGAGKSTTLSILSGMLSPTSGDAFVSGSISVAANPQTIRQSLSVCFQHNVLFDNLTVWEHLSLVCALKATMGVKTVTEATWRSRLQQFRLEDKSDAMAKTLSGGQKRKLSLVLSLLDSSRVLLLDEPTAGMDLKARLDTWDALKRAVTHRAVILTTHSMQEAQALCENIGIVAEGKLKCCGSSLFLRNRYGVGYKLTVVYHDDVKRGEEWNEALMTTLEKYVPNAAIVSDNKWETRVQLNDGDERRFAELFRELEIMKKSRVIKRYAIAATSLEDVFVRVTEGEDVYYHAKDAVKDDARRNDARHVGELGKMEAKMEQVNGIHRQAKGWHPIWSQLWALILKRTKVTFRDKKSLFAQYMWPIGFFAIAMAAFQHVLDSNGSIETVTALASSAKDASLFIASPSNMTNSVMDLVAQLEHKPQPVVFNTTVSTELEMLHAIAHKNSTFFAGIFVSNVNWTSESSLLSPLITYSLFYNESVRRALPVTLQLMSEAYCRVRAKLEDSPDINNCNLVVKRGIYEPDVVIGTGLTQNEQDGVMIDPDEALSIVRRIMVAFYLLMTMSTIAGSYVGPIARERESGLKRMQYQHLETAYASSLYWLSHFLFDYVVYILATLTICLVLAVFTNCLTTEILIVWFATMAVFGLAVIPGQYLSSLVFASHSSAQSYMSYISFFQIMAAALSFALSLVPGLCVKANYFSYVMQAFPLYAFGTATLNIVTVSWAPMRRQCLNMGGEFNIMDPFAMLQSLISQHTVSVWSWDVTGSSWCALIVSGVVSTLLLLLVDQNQMYPTVVKQLIRSRLRALQRLLPHGHGYRAAEQTPFDDEIDQSNMVRAIRISHVYNPRKSTSLEAAAEANAEQVAPVTMQSGQVVALDNVSFSVEKRDCVALLGVNGSGKSTMFEILTAGIAPTSGRALIDGCDVTAQPREASSRYGYCAQGNQYFEDLTVREHLELFYRLREYRSNELKVESVVIDKLMQRLDLIPVATTAATYLSGGNKRRLMLALALLSDQTSLLLLDEPSAGVDVVARRLMWRVLHEKRESVNSTSCLFTTHSMEEAEAVCANAVVLFKGKVVWCGSIPDLKQRISRGIAISVRLDSSSIWKTEQVQQYTELIQRSLKGWTKDFEQTAIKVRQLNEAWEVCNNHFYEKGDAATAAATRQHVETWLAGLRSRFESDSYDLLTSNETEPVIPILEFVQEWLLREAFVRLETQFFQEFTKRSGEAVVSANLDTACGSGSNSNGVYETTCTDEFNLADVFQLLEDNKERFHIAQYSVSELSLERIFEQFSGMLVVFGSLIMAIYTKRVLATRVSFLNHCTHDVNLYDNSVTEVITTGCTTSRHLANGFSGMFRDGLSPEATLAQFAISGGKTWYAISTVPPQAGNCTSYDECAELSGMKGYNVAMHINPVIGTTAVNAECTAVSCLSADCEGAYLYPTDYTKLHNCLDTFAFQVIFCPDESSLVTSAITSSTSLNVADNHDQCSRSPSVPSVDFPITTNINHKSSGGYVAGDFSNASISSSFVYSGINAGSAGGTYRKVTEIGTCTTEEVFSKDPVGPMSEEVSMVFRGPLNIHNIAVFTGSIEQNWSKVSSYDASAGIQDNLVFMSNLNVDYTGANSSPQGYATANATATATESTLFNGWLADAADTSIRGGGPCVSTGCEVNIMTAKKCSEVDVCIGYYGKLGYHGWNGGMKMFVTKVQMPMGSTANMPAIWLLNAQVVRANQYGCNCRGWGAYGGCGEIDISEVIETTTGYNKVSTHYYFYDGTVSPGADNYAARPIDSAVTYVVIIDNSNDGIIKIIEIGRDDFDFSVDAVSAQTVKTWLSTPVKNLLS